MKIVPKFCAVSKSHLMAMAPVMLHPVVGYQPTISGVICQGMNNTNLTAPQDGVSSRNTDGFGCEFCTKARNFGSERGLSQHQRWAHQVEYNQIVQDTDLERWWGSRLNKHWTETEVELMAALELVAMREKDTLLLYRKNTINQLIFKLDTLK